MEKTSSSTNDNTSPLPFVVVIDVIIVILFPIVSNWLSSTQNSCCNLDSELRQLPLSKVSDENLDSELSQLPLSKVSDEKNLDSELRQLPQLYEKKDDGSLSREDVKAVMGNLGIFCSSEGDDLPESFCSNELSGLFDEKEPSLEEVKQAFDVFDENKDGFIDARELQRVLCILGLKEGSKLEDCQRMIRTFDENGDGKIEFFEFVKFMEASFC